MCKKSCKRIKRKMKRFLNNDIPKYKEFKLYYKLLCNSCLVEMILKYPEFKSVYEEVKQNGKEIIYLGYNRKKEITWSEKGNNFIKLFNTNFQKKVVDSITKQISNDIENKIIM